MNFEKNYIISNYGCKIIYKTKFAYWVKLTLYNDPDPTDVCVAYDFVESDKTLMSDYRDTLTLIVAQFSGFFDLSISEDARCLTRESVEINLEYILDKFISKHPTVYTKLSYEQFIKDIYSSLQLSREDVDYFETDFQNNFVDWYTEVIEKLVKEKLYDTNDFFMDMYLFNKYSYYKDLDGMYCERCKQWLTYGEEDGSDYYIISDDLIACPDCVKARNGKYRWLSDFSLIRSKWLQDSDVTCREFIRAIKTPFLKKVYTSYKARHRQITRGKLLDYFKDDPLVTDTIVLRNKFKRNPNSIYRGDLNEVVGYIVSKSCIPFTPELLKEIQNRKKYNLWHKFVVIQAFGTQDEKNKFFNWCMNNNDVFKILDFYTYDDFYEYGYYLLEAQHEQNQYTGLLNCHKTLFREIELIYCEDGDPHELSQLYATNKLYIPH